jgi:GMP synthase-like glutamine amidotransferase
MQLPPKDAEVIAWASPRLSTRYLGEDGEHLTPEYEYEVVYYPNIRALGAQYHPEIMNPSSDGWKYFQELIEEYLPKMQEN